MADLVNLTIDGIPVSVPKGTLLVEAAKTVKQEIPVYCYHTKLGPAGLCRVCLVEIEGMPKLQIACNTVVGEGMVVKTQTDKADAGRAMVIELLLVNHPLDCPICDKGGECDLQDFAMAYARSSSDVADPKVPKPKAVDLGPTIVLDEERCIVCQRCVRFDDIIAGEKQLVVKDRGARDIIATATGEPYHHNFTGNVTELCPVGALTSKTYRFKSRPWDLNRTQTSCTQCAVGCQQFADVRYGTLLRTMSVETDDDISDTWLCDRGRYNIGFYSSPERVTQPLYKKGGTFVQVDWTDAIELWAKAIRDALHDGGPSGVGAIGGGRLTNEEAYLLQHAFRGAGVANLDWRAGHQRQATPGAKSGRLADIENAQAIVVAGQSPEELAPVMWLRVLKALRKGAKLIHEREASAALRQAQGDTMQSVALIWDGIDLAAGKTFADAFAGVAALSTFIASEQGNARGAEAMGMLPGSGPGFASISNAGRDGWGMFEDARNGKLAVLSIFGANPVRNSSVSDAMNAALGSVPFLVVSDLFMTETASHATLVLPAKGALEKSGTTTNLAGDLLPVNQALQPPDGVRSDLEMLFDLCDALGVDLPAPDALDAAVISAAAKVPDFALGDALFKTVACEERQPEHRPILSGGGTWQHDPTMAPLSAGNGVLV
ncbi:MAG TPA: molybdopterin-dependent oxidoreductase [Candidatus Baltobacteraceae bacterium]|jgi:NADH-quinone oxidoreductase subunit G|nr:molybdopterin-dependent oxidoreductase [Candidatus Baltobacteraceae bacterium]